MIECKRGAALAAPQKETCYFIPFILSKNGSSLLFSFVILANQLFHYKILFILNFIGQLLVNFELDHICNGIRTVFQIMC